MCATFDFVIRFLVCLRRKSYHLIYFNMKQSETKPKLLRITPKTHLCVNIFEIQDFFCPKLGLCSQAWTWHRHVEEDVSLNDVITSKMKNPQNKFIFEVFLRLMC